MQRQIHRHADHDGAQHRLALAAPGQVESDASRSAIQAGIWPGGDKGAMADHHLGHDHSGQGGDGRVLQAALGPGRTGQLAVQDEENVISLDVPKWSMF